MNKNLIYKVNIYTNTFKYIHSIEKFLEYYIISNKSLYEKKLNSI